MAFRDTIDLSGIQTAPLTAATVLRLVSSQTTIVISRTRPWGSASLHRLRKSQTTSIYCGSPCRSPNRCLPTFGGFLPVWRKLFGLAPEEVPASRAGRCGGQDTAAILLAVQRDRPAAGARPKRRLPEEYFAVKACSACQRSLISSWEVGEQ